jgi:hypothetical protein
MPEIDIIQGLFGMLLESPLHHFPANGKLDITTQKGVYIIYNPHGESSHVGNTPRGRQGLRQRLNNHLDFASSYTRNFLLPQGFSVRQGYSFRFLEVESARHRVLLEAYAIGNLCPEHIGTYEAQALAAD